jgi:DNA-directed RNA polymerase subunit RPC12/RpoP
MSLAFRCTRCGKAYSAAGHLAGRKVRCLNCGLVQRIPMPADPPSDRDARPGQDAYPLAEVSPPTRPVSISRPIFSGDRERTSGVPGAMRGGDSAAARKPGPGRWRRLVRDYAGESSVLEQEILLLVALSAADLLVTYALLRQGPSFYESNPFAQWVFQRWNIAGMTLFKFGVIGGVIVIGEVAERRRPGLGRGLMAASCLATAVVVVYGLRLLLGFGVPGSA